MQISVEENLKYYQRQHSDLRPAESFPATESENAWLNCAERSEQVLQLLALNGEELLIQLGELRGLGLASRRAYRLIGRFHSMRQSVAQYTTAIPPELHAEYTLLSEQVMPTLARINKRLAARHQQLGRGEARPVTPAAEDTLDIALRAALKRRG